MKNKADINKLFYSSIKIPESKTIVKWCEDNIVMPSSVAERSGNYRIGYTPYLKEVINSYKNIETEKIVFISSAQVGKTSMIVNLIAWQIKQDPSSIIVCLTNRDQAMTFSKEKLAPIFNESPKLKNTFKLKVEQNKKSNSDNLMDKHFSGGFLNFVGSVSVAALSMKSARAVFCDEVSLWENQQALSMLEARQKSFINKKMVITTTPTIKGFCKGSEEYEKSSKGKYKVPCPLCGYFQIMYFKNLKFEKVKKGKTLRIKNIHLKCQKCKGKIKEKSKVRMIEKGIWKHEIKNNRNKGYWINELYSLFVNWENIIRNFLASKDNVAKLKSFKNLSLAEVVEDRAIGQSISSAIFKNKIIDYKKVPAGVNYLTAGVDVQDNRIEYEIVGYGERGRTWGIEKGVIQGVPMMKENWDRLRERLVRTFEKEDGKEIRVFGSCVDSGGHYTEQVYLFCLENRPLNYFAIKGGSTNLDNFYKNSKDKKIGNLLFIIDTIKLKSIIFENIKAGKGEYGEMVFPNNRSYNEEYFNQLTSEYKGVVRDKGGNEKLQWKKKVGVKNEALDCRVYSLACIKILDLNPDEAWIEKTDPEEVYKVYTNNIE